MLDRNGSAQVNRFFRSLQVEAGDKLHSPQNAKRILGKSRTNVSEDSLLDVIAALVRIKQFSAERIESERVHGEVPSFGCLFERQVRVDLYGETLVSGSRLFFRAGQRYFDGQAFYFQYAE